jgi:hypothetical protein
MAFPSRIQGSGNSPLSATNICGDGAVGLVALGSTAATALQLSAVNNTITTSAASTGVKLPPCEVGAEMIIRNDSGQTITVYPYATTTTMNAAASSVTLATAKTMLVKATSATTWVSITGA